jgi:putative transposase
VTVAFVEENRAEFGVEFICRQLQVAASSYYAAKKRQTAPPARAIRDVLMMQVLLTLWMANRKVYGAHKRWKAARRGGHDIGRDQVARLMRVAGMEGARRTKRVRTTRADPVAARHPDLVRRDFTATAPNQLWVTDLTYVPTWAGVAYVCFIVDAFSRMIVGWRVAGNMRTQMVLDAIEMARWSRGTRLQGLRCHSDAGSQGGLNRSSQHLEIIEVWDGTTTATGGSGFAAGDAIAGPANAGQARGAGVLAPDRAREAQRGCRARGRRVGAGRDTLVSSRWRHAAAESGRADRPLPVVLPA